MTRWLFAVAAASAISAGGAQKSPQRLQAETRVEVLSGRTTALQAGLGVNAMAGTNLRIALLVAGGTRHTGGDWRASGRVDVVARFHFDPLRQFPRGFYAGGGGALMFDRGESARTRAVVTIGMEGSPSRHKLILGGEIGLGGGARIGVTARRARSGAR